MAGSAFEGVEGDLNRSPRRAEWSRRHLGDETRRWLEEDSRYFLRQALSTPCLNALARADGIYLEDVEGTHEKNPVTCAAALATIDYIEKEGLVERARGLGAHALARMNELARRHRLIGDVRGLGLLLGIELVRDRETRAPAGDETDRVMYRALERGLSFKVSAGNVLTLTPPLTISRNELERALGIIDDCLTEIEAIQS